MKRESDKQPRPPTPSTCKLYTTISSGVVCLLVALVLAFVDPVVLIAKYRTRLEPGSPIHDFIQKDFESVHVSVYLFNITNAERFVAGKDHKLKVKDVGPFTYRENRRNLNLQLDSEAGLVRYTPYVNLSFLPEESIADPRHVNVTVPNLALLGMTTMLNSYSYFIRTGFNLIVNQVNATPTVNVPAHDFLWGYKDPLISLANTYLPHWIHFDKLGLLDRIYEKRKSRELVLKSRNTDKLQIKSMDGVEGLTMWDYGNPNKRTRCNSFDNVYEGIWYPNDMAADKPVRIYRTALCRFLDLEYVGTQTTSYGCPALVLQIKNNSFTMDEDNKCLCSRGLCVDGMSDISPCYYDLPLTISNVHFTGADAALGARIEGLTPDPEKYASRFLIEPILGMAVGTDFWIQVNLVTGDIRYNSAAAPFAKMVVPIGYLRITQPPLPAETEENLTAMYVTAPRVRLAITIASCVTGLSLLAYSVWLLRSNSLYSDGRGLPVLILEKTEKKPAALNSDAKVPLTSVFY